jgi:thiamine-phosphate pyrophosphorylase
VTHARPGDAGFALMLVSDAARSAEPLPETALGAVRNGIGWFQVREKDRADGALLALVGAVVSALAGTSGRVLVNGRPDLAMLAGACGVHLPEEGLPARDVRDAYPALTVGVSCHSVDACRRAEQAGAHYALLGPVFATPGKETRVLGLDVLAEAASAVRIPVHAVGGVEAHNARAVRDAGARGLAAIRPFLQDPAGAAAAFVAALA